MLFLALNSCLRLLCSLALCSNWDGGHPPLRGSPDYPYGHPGYFNGTMKEPLKTGKRALQKSPINTPPRQARMRPTALGTRVALLTRTASTPAPVVWPVWSYCVCVCVCVCMCVCVNVLCVFLCGSVWEYCVFSFVCECDCRACMSGTLIRGFDPVDS